MAGTPFFAWMEGLLREEKRGTAPRRSPQIDEQKNGRASINAIVHERTPRSARVSRKIRIAEDESFHILTFSFPSVNRRGGDFS